MKKFILITVIFFFENAYSNINIVYVDVQRIIDSSDIGIFYKNEMLPGGYTWNMALFGSGGYTWNMALFGSGLGRYT